MKTTNYSIILITDSEVKEIAVVSSKGLAHQTLKLLEGIYKDNNFKLVMKESKKKLNIIDKASYYLNGEKF